MKFKKLMFTASSLAVGASLVGTILTSCSKATVDEKLKISLDDNGYLSNDKTQKNFKAAVKDALTRSTNWTTFKAALADEIVYRWYLDRAAENKDSDKKNTKYRVNLDEWTDKINKDYDETIKALKNKYGDKWEFYLQNETLAPMGGTEETYKHAKLVEKVRAEFLSKVFATNYFGIKTNNPKSEAQLAYPNIYSEASINVSEDKLNDPTTWANLGFYARTNTSFVVSGDTIDTDYLAKNPDGDFAEIQDYVFNRWFKTEKPFFSAAALFKYSNPKYVAESKLSEIYNGVSTGVKIPDNPNESFPFFGGYATTDAKKGTRAYANWYQRLEKDGFSSLYQKEDGTWVGNGTITIPAEMTEDSQTLLLSFGSQMIGGSANALYIPYANAAASLYMQMMTGDAEYKPGNTIEQSQIFNALYEETAKGSGVYVLKDVGKDGSFILSNFMYPNVSDGSQEPGLKTITSYVDLNKIYGGLTGDVYHCPLFRDTKDYHFFYGDTSATDTNGIRYVTNTVQVDLGKGSKGTASEFVQPWIFELNEAGMHAQTIDGYQIVNKAADKQEALKQVIKYRLMQKKCGYNSAIISGDVFGDSGKLKTYFSDNFTNIILELAFNNELKYNVFKSIDSYTDVTSVKEDNLFLKKVLTDEKLGEYADILAYLKLTITYEDNKKYLDAYETANTKTYAYRTKQMENARTEAKHLTVFENGLLAPIAYETWRPTVKGTAAQSYITSDITVIGENGQPMDISRESLIKDKEAIANSNFVKSVDNIAVNTDLGLSPQISTAKSKTSNRFWYKSYLIDKMMYTYMSNKEGMANAIKGDAMDKYIAKVTDFDTSVWGNTYFQDAIAVTYAESKLFTNDRNYANFGEQADADSVILKTLYNQYFGSEKESITGEYDYKLTTNGQYCEDYLNLQTYKATLAYLLGSDYSFKNFYNILNTKISEDEMAVVGYISKTNKNVFGSDVDKATETIDTNSPYYWTADVNNIFDKTGYAGGTTGELTDAKIASDQYWKVISKQVGDKTAAPIALAGFTGIQTKSTNQIDSGSKLQAAIFDKFAASTDASRILTGNVEDEFKKDGRYVENYGCWFAYAGINDVDGKPFALDEIKWEGHETITTDNFKLTTTPTVTYSPALKLGSKISKYRTLDDLRSLAKKLGAAYYGDSVFRQIGDGTKQINDINEMKWTMVNELIKKTESTQKYPDNLKCFQRMTDAEAHEAGSDAPGNKEYGFTDDKGNTFRMLFTQINKSDVVEKKFAPTWDAEKKTWVVNSQSPIEIQEFLYIISNMAMESSVQQLAISDVVKTVYGDDKLIVYDAQLYNCFDSVWIKDWSKKTMGA